MKILGLMWEQNSTAALMVNGEVLASVSEERFSREKNDERYPKRAIEYVLKEGGVKPAELDAVAFISLGWGPMYSLTRHYSRFSIQDNVHEQREYWKPLLYEKEKPNYVELFKDKLDLAQYPGKRIWNQVLADMHKLGGSGRAADNKAGVYFQQFRSSVVARHLHIDPKKVHFIDHSTGHAAYAYFGSPMRTDALIATADAWGDNINATLTTVRNGVMERLYQTDELIIARLYRYVTLILGMKPNEHEYKVMGLAPYAKKKYWQEPLALFRNAQKVDGIGFRYIQKPSDMYFYFLERLEGVRFDTIAGALQAYVEELLLKWLTNTLTRTKQEALCFAGGVAMNIKANMLINRLSRLKRFYVNPSPDDASQAMGACYAFAYAELLRRGKDPRAALKPLPHAYLGPEIKDSEINALIQEKKIFRKCRIGRATPTRIATLLAAGKIIGRAAGRSEFGARALGNRSILADPRNADVVPLINDKIKSRDFWMPFAPSILESHAESYLIGYRGGSSGAYMTIGYETTPRGQRDLRAGLHPADKTCRPQVLPRGQNSEYEAIIKAFAKKTGVGALLNTSFNLHGEPIVQSAADAWRVFVLSDLDALVLNDMLLEKK